MARIPPIGLIYNDDNEPIRITTYSSGVDFIDTVYGGTGRPDISGLFSSIDNVPVTYNEATKQFIVGTVEAEAVVGFDNIRDAFASGTGTLAFSGDIVVSGGGKIRGAFSGNLQGNADTATNAIYSVESLVIRDVKFNGIEVDLSGGADIAVSASQVAFSAIQKAFYEGSGNISYSGLIVLSGGGAVSGNLSGLASSATSATNSYSSTNSFSSTTAFRVPRVQINGTFYDLSSDGNDIAVGGAVTYSGVSGAIFTGVGPLFFNNNSLSGINTLSSTNVTGINIRGTTVSATTSFSSPLATLTTVNATTVTGVNVTGTNVVGTTSVRGASVSATTEFSGPAATITTVNATTVTGVNVTGTNIRGGTVSATTSFSGPAATITSFTATDLTAANVRGTTSVSSLSITGTSLNAGDFTATGNTTLAAFTGTNARINGTLQVTSTIDATGNITTTGIVQGSTVKGTTVSATNYQNIGETDASSFNGVQITPTSFSTGNHRQIFQYYNNGVQEVVRLVSVVAGVPGGIEVLGDGGPGGNLGMPLIIVAPSGDGDGSGAPFIVVSGIRLPSSLTLTAGQTLMASGSSGTLIAANTVTGIMRANSFIQPVHYNGSLHQYNESEGLFYPTQSITIPGLTADMYVSAGAGIRLYGGGGLNISGGSYAYINGNLSATTVSATNYLNLPSSTIVWASANYATLAGSSTSSLIATNATSATSALNAQQAPAGFTVTGTLSAGAVSAATVSAAEAFYVDGATGYIVNPTGNLTLSSVGGTIATNSTMNVANGSGNIFLRAGRAAIYTDTAASAYYIATNNYADPRMNFAIAQTSAGDSYVGAKSGQSISFVVPANTVSSLVTDNRLMQIEASGINVRTGIVSTSSILAGTVSATTYLNVKPYVSAVDSATTTTVNIAGDYDTYLVNTTTTGVTLYLPDASAYNNKKITVSKIEDVGSYRAVTLSGTQLQTATNTVLLYDPTESVTVISNGTNWYSMDYDRAYGVVVVCKNSTGATLTKGTPVKVTGATGANILIGAASAANDHVPQAPNGDLSRCIGVVEHNIPTGEFGHVLTKGNLYKFNTNAYNEGDILYLAPSGGFTNVKPAAPYDEVFLGIVTRKNVNNGSILIDVTNPIHINDIVGFNLASGLINGDLISYDTTTSTFVNSQAVNVSGQGKFGSVSATNISGTTITATTLSATTISTPKYPTYIYTATGISVGTNKLMFDMFNGAGSGKTLKVTRIVAYVRNTTTITGINQVLECYRTSSVGTGGTTVTEAKMVTSDPALNVNITARNTPTGGASYYNSSGVLAAANIYTEEGQNLQERVYLYMYDSFAGLEECLTVQQGEGLRINTGAVGAAGVIAIYVYFITV